jgi:hypothetical protein
MALATPSEVFHRLVRSLPSGPAGFLWNLTYIFAWITLPYSIYGAIRDLAFVIHYVVSFSARLPELLLGAFGWAVGQVDATLTLWRVVTAPIREWMASQPIPFAEQLADVSVVPLLLLPSFVRFGLHRGIFIAEDVAARITRSEAELAARRAAEAAAAKEAERGENVSGGIAGGILMGAVVGGPVGAVVGGIIGAIAGALGSGDDGADQPDSAAAARAEERARRAAIARRRYDQSRTILVASLLAAGLVTALIAANWRFSPQVSEPAPCATIRAVGEVCRCEGGWPEGVAYADPAGGRNRCPKVG